MAGNRGAGVLDAELARRTAAMAHPLFVKYGWEWGWSNPHVPTVEEIEASIADLIHRVRTEELQMSGSGRFTVRRYLSGLEVSLALGQVFARGIEVDDKEAIDA